MFAYLYVQQKYSFPAHNKYSTFCRRILRFRSATERLFLFFHFYHFLYVHMYWSDECSLEERTYILCPLLTKIHIFLIYMPRITRTRRYVSWKSDRCCRREIVITDSEVSIIISVLGNILQIHTYSLYVCDILSEIVRILSIE